MNKMSHVAGWTSESPTPAQIKEFFSQIQKGSRNVNKTNFQKFLRGVSDEPKGEARAFTVLKQISAPSAVILGSCDGNATIAKAKKVFCWRIDPDFINWHLDNPGNDTPEEEICVYRMLKSAASAEMFSSISLTLNTICLTQAQIIKFVQEHKFWLGATTLFLFRDKAWYYVARVTKSFFGKPMVNVDQYDRGYVWKVEDNVHLIAPQQ